MTDIVERLRRGATSGVLIPCEDLIQAAEIIEQYRADAAYDECTINFLKAGSVAQAVQKPFAWRWNTRADQRWRVTVNRPVPTKLTAFDKIDPLYTSVVGDEMPRHAPQTIETAPKDGTHILAWRVPVGIRVTNNTNPPAVVHWFDDPDEPGFYTSVNERAPEHPFNPTHWERLPDPPLSHARNENATSSVPSASSPAQASWMPIETSPRNGEPVLIYVPINTPDRRTLSAYWTEAGWWICSGSVVLGKPTHWMPFPVPPIPSVERKFTGPGHLEQTGYSVPSAHSGSARE